MTTGKIVIGKSTDDYNKVFYNKGKIEMSINDGWEIHKSILDITGIYAEFWPVKSGNRAYIKLVIHAPDLFPVLKALKKVGDDLGFKFYKDDIIKQKLNKVVAEAI